MSSWFLFDALFGDEGACTAYWWPPSMRDTLRAEHRTLHRQVRAIDRDMARDAGQLETLKRATQKHWADGRREQAWQSALELHRAQLAYRMTGIQKNNVLRVADKMKQQMNAVTVDSSLVLVTRVMAARMHAMHPERFARMMQQYDELKAKEEMNEEQLNDFFSTNEDRDMERTEDELGTDEQRVRQVWMELGLASAPDAPQHDPTTTTTQRPGYPPSTGTGGGGGDKAADEATEAHALQQRMDTLLRGASKK